MSGRLEDVILRGTRAAQPLATAVGPGTLYFVTSENVLERSNGTIWQSYSGISGAGIGSPIPFFTESEEPSESVIVFQTPSASSGSSSLTVEEVDGAPSVSNVNTIVVSNGTLTDDGAGQVTLAISGGSGEMPPVTFKPDDNEPPTAAYATIDTRNVHPVLNFDAATDESAVFSGFLPSSYAGGGLTITCFWVAATAVAGDILVDVSIERDDVGGLDIDADSFAAVQSDTGTAPGTSGQIFITTHEFTSGAEMDSLAAGECFRVKVTRDANAGGDTMAGDAQLLRVVVVET